MSAMAEAVWAEIGRSESESVKLLQEGLKKDASDKEAQLLAHKAQLQGMEAESKALRREVKVLNPTP